METEASVTRVHRAFAFLDISGFTNFTDQHGDTASVNALAAFRVVVRDVASHQGIRIDKWLGDGAMFVAVEEPPLIGAILDIETRLRESNFPLELRAGLAAGAVILFEGDDYIGTPVNLASRLCSEAGPGEILSTVAVSEFAPSGVSVHEKGRVDVRGLTEPVEVVALHTDRVLREYQEVGTT